ncbi:MAG: hypothetical protein RI900_2658, partial [Actinomycetota bacterium]
MTDVDSVLLVTKGLDLGGIERVVVDLAKGLRRAGVHTEVAVVNGRRAQFAPVLRAEGIPVHLLEGTDRLGVRGVRQLLRLVREPRFRLVHVHGPLPTVVARMARVGLGGRPVVTTVHTLWAAHRLPSRVVWRLTARLDAATVAVSQAVADSLPGRRDVSVVPHGVDDVAVAAARSTAAMRAPAPLPTVVVVASHRGVKNYPNLLKAIHHARKRGTSAHVLAIGEGPDLAAHQRLADELTLRDVVEFLGPRLDVLEVMATADLLVVASDREGQPLVVSEALALGVPVVATSVGRVPELVDESVGRVVP